MRKRTLAEEFALIDLKKAREDARKQRNQELLKIYKKLKFQLFELIQQLVKLYFLPYYLFFVYVKKSIEYLKFLIIKFIAILKKKKNNNNI